jgi:hypothetical protein
MAGSLGPQPVWKLLSEYIDPVINRNTDPQSSSPQPSHNTDDANFGYK